MATLIDGQVGIKKETTYGTPVTVDRFYEVLPDSTHDFDPMRIEGEGLKVGATHKRADRAVAGVGKGELTIKVELISKSLGVLLEEGLEFAQGLVAVSHQQGLPRRRPGYE